MFFVFVLLFIYWFILLCFIKFRELVKLKEISKIRKGLSGLTDKDRHRYERAEHLQMSCCPAFLRNAAESVISDVAGVFHSFKGPSNFNFYFLLRYKSNLFFHYTISYGHNEMSVTYFSQTTKVIKHNNSLYNHFFITLFKAVCFNGSSAGWGSFETKYTCYPLKYMVTTQNTISTIVP